MSEENLEKTFIVVDLGYYYLKSIDPKSRITLLRNTFFTSSESDTSILLDESEIRKVTLCCLEPGIGIVEKTRVYGQASILGSDQGTNRLKFSDAKFSFAAILNPEQNKKSLTVIYLHNEDCQFEDIRNSLLGDHSVRINGSLIHCFVEKVLFEKEGADTYFTVMKQYPFPKTGAARILDLGYGVANDIMVDSGTGKITFYRTHRELSVYTLVKDIFHNKIYQAHMKNLPENFSSLAYALEKDTPVGNIPSSEWERVKISGLRDYLKKIQQYLLAPHTEQSSLTNTYILTGGGAILLKNVFGSLLEKAFIIPDDSNTSSLRGVLENPRIKKEILNLR